MIISASFARIPSIASPPLDPHAREWDSLPSLPIAHFHGTSSTHRPSSMVQLGHDDTALFLRFSIDDCFVVSRETAPNGPVCTDSSVEFFFEPLLGLGYFNLEINAGGTIHCSHMTDHRLHPDGSGFIGCSLFDTAELESIAVASTLPRVIDPEIKDPLPWALCVRLPIALLTRRLGSAPPIPGLWRANFYKCAHNSSHPHWASWAPIGPRLAFHAPEYFGTLEML